MSPSNQISDIFIKYGELYRRKYPMPLNQLRAMKAIQTCKTEKLGAHVYECEKCGNVHVSYNSCRNRHCPKCQYHTSMKWIEKISSVILPTHYYHVVFTVPSELNNIIYSNQKLLYSILFKSASETLIKLTKDVKYLGAQVGIIGILHTWGQNLSFHPHIHFLVTGGGLCNNTKKWKKGRKNFLLPVKVLSRLFRSKFLILLKKEMKDIKIEDRDLIDIIRKNYKKEWIVFCKKPFLNPSSVIEYFGRYTHRVAISNNRIIKIENDKVYFKYKDYSDKNLTKTMSLFAVEFIRRFLFHILPKKFVKIRYYGLYANRDKAKKVEHCRSLLQENNIAKKISNEIENYSVCEITNCSKCKEGKMVLKEIIPAGSIHSPPSQKDF